jgi:hypothetical protein
MSHQKDVLDPIKKGIINDDITAIIEKIAKEVEKRIALK